MLYDPQPWQYTLRPDSAPRNVEHVLTEPPGETTPIYKLIVDMVEAAELLLPAGEERFYGLNAEQGREEVSE